MDTNLDDDSIQMEDIKHVWYFEPVLEHIVFICHKSPSNKAHVSVWLVLKPLQIWKVVHCIPALK